MPSKRSIWCLAPLVDGGCMLILEKEVALRTHLGYRRILSSCTLAKPLATLSGQFSASPNRGLTAWSGGAAKVGKTLNTAAIGDGHTKDNMTSSITACRRGPREGGDTFIYAICNRWTGVMPLRRVRGDTSEVLAQ
jgi:hypothetical protein